VLRPQKKPRCTSSTITTTTTIELPSAEDVLYPPIEPYVHGLLDVGDGQQLYWEECGNPDGKPAVFVHGGPGGGIVAGYRRFFDPARYRVILFDQRNCGRSLPHASEPRADLSTNTTWHLADDLEKLRADRGVERWQVFGGSWGSALALAYAQAHPDRVTELVLRGIFTLRRSELDWYYNGGAGHLSPKWWRSFMAPLGGEPFSGDRMVAYHDLLFDPDPAVHQPAGVAWTTWEAATTTLEFSQESVDEFSDPAFALAFARIENHFFVNEGWMREGQLIEEVGRIRHIPAVLVQGRYDLACPVVTADDLHRAWPEADYRLVLAGHSAMEPAIAAELVAATDRFAATA
jgi:proline iminopeptidase